MTVPDLQAMVDNVRRSAIGLATALQAPMRQFGEALHRFGDVYYRAAEQAYIAAYGQLPGSTRTARLRKKRRDMVLRWFNDRIREYALRRRAELPSGVRG